MSNRTTTMNFPTTLQQQGLIKEYPESQAPNMRYPVSAPSPHQQTYSSGYSTFGDPVQFHPTTQANHQQHYSTEQLQYHQQQQHIHYNNTYNNRLISDATLGANNNVSSGPVSSIYSNRARYLPYPHILPQHSMRGMYTPAGQQLIPSSVLHYPPRSAAYQPNTMTLQQQRSVLPEQYSSAPQTQPTRQPYLRQQQQLSPQSQLLQRQTSFGANESQMRHYADALNTTQSTYGQATRQTPHLMMHLNGSRSPPATLISPPSPAPTQTARSVSLTPSDDSSTRLQLRHQFRQQSLSSPSAAQTLSNEELLTANMPTSLRNAESPELLHGTQIQSGSSTSSELSKVSEDAQDSSRDCHEEKHQTSTSHSAINNNGLASASKINLPRQMTSSECLTTSPPLISATGTDSGISISSCSTRARSDSTQSTPVYNGEYPMSVGSSSGVSYQCADIKDFEEFGKEKDEHASCAPLNENEILKFNQEIVEDDINMGHSGSAVVVEENSSNMKEQNIDQGHFKDRNLFEAKKQCDDKTEESDNSTALSEAIRSPGTLNNIEQSSDTHRTKESFNELTLNAQKVVSKNQEMKSEPEECTELPLHQQQTHKEQPANDQIGGKIRESTVITSNNMRTPTPISQCSQPHLEPSALKEQELPSPPVPPAPPQNSPVDYCRTSSISNMNAFAYVPPPMPQPKAPTSAAAAAAAAAVAAAAAAAAASIRTNKNRIMECDLIPSRKSKRKSNLLPGKRQEDNERGEASESMKDKRDMTPLPGFQQAFGSTEIGRFFETFLLSPPDCHSFTDNYEPLDADEQWQQIHQHQQQQQHQLQIKPDQQPLELNQLQQHKQQQQQQQYAQQEYVQRRYADNNNYPSPHQRLYPHYPHSTLHPSHPYHRGQSYPFHISANSNHRDMWMYGRNGLNPYVMPFEYGAARSESSSPSSPYQMPLNLRSGYGSAYDGRGYSYGRMNGSYSGIRCNGY